MSSEPEDDFISGKDEPDRYNAAPMTSPADKATDDVRGLVERLTRPRRTNFYGFAEVHPDFLAKTAAALTSLLERAERAEARIKELEQEMDRTIDSGEALCRLLNPHNLPAGAEQQLETTVEQFCRARAVKGE